MPIPESFLEELNSRTDILDLVSSYVSLTKKGNKYWGLCPFHSEKTPSFSVSPDKQMYYCFGCHKGGGAINFVMELEGLGFVDAVDLLDTRSKISVRLFSSSKKDSGIGILSPHFSSLSLSSEKHAVFVLFYRPGRREEQFAVLRHRVGVGHTGDIVGHRPLFALFLPDLLELRRQLVGVAVIVLE